MATLSDAMNTVNPALQGRTAASIRAEDHRSSKGLLAGFWASTALFCLQMSFTAYNELASPQVVQVFAHLGFPSHAFQVELSAAKILGVLALLLPFVPPRLKEWAYAGFAINLVSALIAHFAVSDGVAAWGWAAGTGVLWGLSYFFWRCTEAGVSVG